MKHLGYTARYVGEDRPPTNAGDILAKGDLVNIIRVPSGEFMDGHEFAFVEIGGNNRSLWLVHQDDLRGINQPW